MNRKTITVAISLLLALTAFAQQSNVNLSYNPQKDTEGLIPFSANLNSPQVNDDHTVVFRLRAPKAESVALSGAMTTVLGVRGNIPFTKGEDGIWTLTIGPLPVDMYQYNLVVDGVSMADPNNTYAASMATVPPGGTRRMCPTVPSLAISTTALSPRDNARSTSIPLLSTIPRRHTPSSISWAAAASSPPTGYMTDA